ncbi:MAG: FGGY family carbohydrate kinase [Flavobacteriaceae bacterium]|nr:FGGY family carbohydrate kinase [Flavobacteriaceae bacterium]MDG1942326.1 FGGY family carbohydrate kinase [Flavobacteriaceae bacterium]
MIAIGFDIGSSFVKAALVEVETGKPIARARVPEVEIPMEAQQLGWAEQHPNLWWQYLCEATQKLLTETDINAEQISSIGISYQMHGLVLVDRDLNPLRKSIIWCDSRATSYGEKAFEKLGKGYCKDHLLNSPGNFTASKLAWVIENEPELYQKAYKLMLPGDFLAAKLSGIPQTTITGLSEGIFWDFKNDQASQALFDHYQIDQSLVPEVVDNFTVQATVSNAGAQATGLKEGTPITYRAGDQPNNAYTLGARKAGDVVATGGTSGVVYALTDQLSGNELTKVNTFAHVNYQPQQKMFGKLLNLNGAGIQYRWLHQFMGEVGYEKLNEMAQQAPIGSNGLQVFPFGNGAERMLDNKIVNGHISNINFNIHDNNHMVRATLEGIAFAMIYGIEILKNDGVDIENLKVGNDNLFLSDVFSKTIADTLGISIQMLEATGAEGAAKASISNPHQTQNNDNINITKTIKPNPKLQVESIASFEKWKTQLLNNII